VLIELGARLGLPGLVEADGSARYRDFADYIQRHERAPGLGLLAGWRGAQGERDGKGPPNPEQIARYVEHGSFWRHELPQSARYYKMANRDYLQWAQQMGFVGSAEPIVLQLYSETLQKFRLAAQGHGAVQPPERERARVATYFDPLPVWYLPFESEQSGASSARAKEATNGSSPRLDPEPSSVPAGHLLPVGEGNGGAGHTRSVGTEFPLHAITQRPMFMYHAWGSQNAWLRQIATRNWLYLHPDTARRHGIDDEDWVHVDSHHGRITVQAKFAANVQPDTVWTWNAIGKRKGAWKLSKDAPEATHGFLLNHLISDRTPRGDYSNSDPVTGQAAWFDLRVRIAKAEARGEAAPQFAALPRGEAPRDTLRYGADLRGRER
jgi:anaerobic selenocysteine-containing dehydrogenase